MKTGDRIHIDVDDEEYGRVASNATIIDEFDGGYLVSVDSIRANIVIDEHEAKELA